MKVAAVRVLVDARRGRTGALRRRLSRTRKGTGPRRTNVRRVVDLGGTSKVIGLPLNSIRRQAPAVGKRGVSHLAHAQTGEAAVRRAGRAAVVPATTCEAQRHPAAGAPAVPIAERAVAGGAAIRPVGAAGNQPAGGSGRMIGVQGVAGCGRGAGLVHVHGVRITRPKPDAPEAPLRYRPPVMPSVTYRRHGSSSRSSSDTSRKNPIPISESRTTAAMTRSVRNWAMARVIR